MTHMRAVKLLLASILCLFAASVFATEQAAKKENLFIFVFKEGVSQQDILVKVGDVSQKTNEFGLASFALPAGDYEVGYYKGEALFALTEVALLDTVSSQVFLNLTKQGEENVELDLPLSAYEQDFDHQDVKPQTGPKGNLLFTVRDTANEQPIAGAKLFFKGYLVEATTDENGLATIELAEGQYDVSVIHPKYVMQVSKDVKIRADQDNEHSARMIKADIVLDEFVVSAPAVEGSLASTFTEMRESSVIGDALSSEEFSKSGDSSAADALKRVTGITIVGGKYVYVRGLGERYSVVLLNDLHIPSPEPTKRVVPLDIFPSSVIQSMNIQKTWGPDLPGTFGGGDVLIKSKDIPEQDNYVSLNISGTYHDAVGDSYKTNSDNGKGMPSDIVEKSANFQELTLGRPSLGVPGYTRDELDAINAAIANYRSYNLKDTKLDPGYKASLGVGQSFKTSNGLKYGFVGNIYGSTEVDVKEVTEYDPEYKNETNTLLPGDRSDYTQVDLSEKAGGLLSLSLSDDENHKLKYTFLGFFDETESTTFNRKDGGQTGPGTDDEERAYLSYIEQSLEVHQLGGEHKFGTSWLGIDALSDIEMSWGIESAEATRYEPATVEYTYEKTSDVTDFTLNKGIWFLYSDLEDEVENARFDLKIPYEINGLEHSTSFGFFDYSKSRKLDNRRFKAEHDLGTDVFEDIDSVFTQETVDNDDLVLTSNYRADDAYTANQDVTAFYLNQQLSFSDELELVAGVRIEDSTQELIDTKKGERYDDPLETNDVLPSLILNYALSDEHVFRLGYSSTLSRPDFREFAPNRYKDPITENIVFGEPGLNYTTIDNFDFKYEWYLSYDEMFSFGLFRKDFTNPIETIIKPDTNSQDGNKLVSYRNAVGATSNGFELGVRKKLGFLADGLEDFFLSSNFAYIDSNIELDKNVDDDFIQDLTSTDRPMQGQSPYVLNLNVGYDNIHTGRSAVLAFNQFGKRIVALGTNGAPDHYEQPFAKLDFVVKWQLNDTYDEQVKKIGYSLGMKISNVLNSTQEIRQGSQVVETYEPGTSINLSFAMKY